MADKYLNMAGLTYLWGKITEYVSANSGNALKKDTTYSVGSGGTYTTIQAAINAIPKNLGGHTARIEVASGTYTGDVVIDSFVGGKLIITGTATINGEVQVNYCSAYVQIDTFTISDAYRCVHVNGSRCVLIFEATFTGGGTGVIAETMSSCTVDGCTFQNLSVGAKSVNGEMTLTYATMRNVTNAMWASAGVIWGDTLGLSSITTKYTTDGGGRIYEGAQTSVPFH